MKSLELRGQIPYQRRKSGHLAHNSRHADAKLICETTTFEDLEGLKTGNVEGDLGVNVAIG